MAFQSMLHVIFVLHTSFQNGIHNPIQHYAAAVGAISCTFGVLHTAYKAQP